MCFFNIYIYMYKYINYNNITLAEQGCIVRSRDFVFEIYSQFSLCCASGRPLALPLFLAANISDVVQIMLLFLPVSQSEAGREACSDRTCKSISNKD